MYSINLKGLGENCMVGMQNMGVNSDLLLGKSNQNAGVSVKVQK